MRAFNIAGPCQADIHYVLPPLARLPEVRRLIDSRTYFVLHAPRQTGKTTAALQLAAHLTAEGRYTAVMLSVEVGEPFAEPAEAEPAILKAWRRAASWQLPADLQPPPWPEDVPGTRIGAALSAWAQHSERPLVVLLDEVDALPPRMLSSLLRQLRDGFPGRPQAFPWSLALVGMRDVRDYVLAAGGSGRRGAGSPFNVKAESITLRNFDRAEVAALYGQHTEETGQAFTEAAIDRAFELTDGQPWLVNALARQCVASLESAPGTPVDVAHVDAAKEALILRRDTHLDSLAERLREPRIRRVIEPILAGQTLAGVEPDDVRFALELGLVRVRDHGGVEIANPIYHEVIPRALAETAQYSLPRIEPAWLTSAGDLDEAVLLDAFLAFWRQHGEPLLGTSPYHEIAPHLVLMAFLHRVVNGGGSIEREYAIGSGRMGLCVRYRQATLAMELKVWRPGAPDPLTEGLEQLDGYLAGLGLDHGWLVIFDRRPESGRLADRTHADVAVSPGGRRVTVVRA
ncbi:MAG: ATP-binding protein [Myxococcales bacterium]|nr:ATP-binding protein [Myxococcales bacterium]